jgi:hypothetical protein
MAFLSGIKVFTCRIAACGRAPFPGGLQTRIRTKLSGLGYGPPRDEHFRKYTLQHLFSTSPCAYSGPRNPVGLLVMRRRRGQTEVRRQGIVLRRGDDADDGVVVDGMMRREPELPRQGRREGEGVTLEGSRWGRKSVDRLRVI